MQPTVQARFDRRHHASCRRALFAAALAAAVASIAATAYAQDTKEVQKSGDWTLFSHSGQSPMCFLTARARESEPKGQRRAGHFYITSWPKDGVKRELSVSLGAALKAGSEVVVAVGPTKFKFFAQGDKAFISAGPDEAKMLASLKKGNLLTVDATSAAGAQLKDKYSLIGIGQGIQSLDKGCN